MWLYRFLTATSLVFLLSTAVADQKERSRALRAAPLLASQLYVELLPLLSEQLANSDRTAEQIDYLVFRITEQAARCSTEEFDSHDLPQVQSFIDLLTTNGTISSVTHALNRMYTEKELDKMQSEVQRITKECTDAALQDLGLES